MDDFSIEGERVRWNGRDKFLVESRSEDGHHCVERGEDGEWVCSCIGFNVRKTCRHQLAIQKWAEE